jgi:hypothetical protein
VLHLVDCNTGGGASADEFQFSLVDDIDKKRIELHALGKSGFTVAIGPVQQPNALGRTLTIKLNNSGYTVQDISFSDLKQPPVNAGGLVPTPIKSKM